MGEQYVIGLDYGTLSGRAILVRLRDGVTVASSVLEYAHGVMDTWFSPSEEIRRKLPPDVCEGNSGDFRRKLPPDVCEGNSGDFRRKLPPD
ncbi:MAG: hypothetical protein IKY52_01915, partial [Clostridia bacterium]|nr:hypothetical protein [Clostridia bacterium]